MMEFGVFSASCAPKEIVQRSATGPVPYTAGASCLGSLVAVISKVVWV